MKTLIMILTILGATSVWADGRNCANGNSSDRYASTNTDVVYSSTGTQSPSNEQGEQ